jgi:hypothetical protein
MVHFMIGRRQREREREGGERRKTKTDGRCQGQEVQFKGLPLITSFLPPGPPS